MRDKYSLLEQVSETNLKRDVIALSTRWPTRHTLSRHHDAIATALTQRFKASGYVPRYHLYTRSGKSLKNVIADKAGPATPMILVCAHFDSRQQQLDQPESPAPGANDNATGVAVLWELARLLQPLKMKHPLRFCLFSGEEQDLWGSTAYAKELHERKTPIEFVYNLDQVGYPSKKRELFLDRDEGGPKSNNAASAKLVARLETLAQTVVKVPTKIDPVEGSDYVPFEQRGYVVTGLYEGEYRYPHYHKDTDTADKVDFAYVRDMARLSLAFLLDYAL